MTRKAPLALPKSTRSVFNNAWRPSQFFSLGLFSALILLGLCVIIRPDSLNVNYGLSYFGIFISTIVPYAAAFMLYAFFLWKASEVRFEDSGRGKILTWVMRIMSIQVIGLLLTPYNRLYNIHVFFGASLFSLQLLLSLALLIWLVNSWVNASLVIIEFLSGLASLYYLPQSHGLLLQTQVIFQFAFGLLMIRTLKTVETSKLTRSPAPLTSDTNVT